MLENITTKSWWALALTSDTAILCAVLACGCLLLAIPVLRAWVGADRCRSGPRCKRPSPLGDQAGTATIEFALVFPIVLVLALLLVQVTLLMVGNLFVHYAAYCATRSAITYIPADASSAGGAGPNVVIPLFGSPKLEKIREAAVFALLPVSGRLDEADVATDGFVSGLRDHFSFYGQSQPPWVDSLAADRLRYADTNTDVTLAQLHISYGQVGFSNIRNVYKFGPRDPVTVRVEHRLNLAVPYVRAFFSDGEHQTADGLGAYAEVKAQYTLTNEGIDTDLPPEPNLPRLPK